MDRLTIAIPTFNRHEKLLETLNQLHLFKNELPVDIIVIDNFSSPPVLEYLIDNNYAGLNYTKIIRNNANIGGNANILMCFTHTETDWMWLLGDDDLPKKNCLIDILNDIKKTDNNDFLIKYNSDAGGFPDHETTINNEHEFINFCSNYKYYSNMLFISNSVFRTKAMKNHLRLMFEFTNSMAPHIVGILKNVSENNRIKIINTFITEHGVASEEDSWDWHRLREGVLYFSDLQNHNEFKTKVASKLFEKYLSANNFYIHAFVYPFRYENYSPEYWKWYYWKSAFLFTGVKSIYLNLLSSTVKYYLTSSIINLVVSTKIKAKKTTDLNRL